MVEQPDGGRCLAKDRVVAIDAFRKQAQANVGRCQRAIDQQAYRDEVRLEEALKIKDSEAQEREDRARYDAEGFSGWTVLGVGLGCGAGGLLVGLIAGFAAGR